MKKTKSLILLFLFISSTWSSLNSMDFITKKENRATLGFSLTMAMVLILAKKSPKLLELLRQASGIILILQIGKHTYDVIQYTKHTPEPDAKNTAAVEAYNNNLKVIIYANVNRIIQILLFRLVTEYMHANQQDNFTLKNAFLTLLKRLNRTSIDDIEKFGKYYIAMALGLFAIIRSNKAKSSYTEFEFEAIKTNFKFTDVAGAHEAKQALKQIVSMLQNPQEYNGLSAKLPRGILLLGPPGCGKTLLAKALAGEASCNFFSVSGSEFHTKWHGEGQTKIRNLFAQARKNSPAIIFIDEFDALAIKRSGEPYSEHYKVTLDQLLVEMDGMESDHKIVVVAATNLPKSLDSGAIRAGRFDRKIRVESPQTTEERLEVLKIHTAELTAQGALDPNIDLTPIAQNSVGFSAAELANLVNQAKLIAIEADKNIIEFSHFALALARIDDSQDALED
ncbi:MAG: AAA family ATPase [Candidatus Babeliales bacterium]|nr:AAA family ATPase [Candidatus Babeliales bacterium]